MARRMIRSYGEREALWSLALAGLGVVSIGATLPAAVLLGARAIRRRRVVDGSEPAIGALSFGVGLVSFLLVYPALRAIVLAAAAGGSWRPWTFLGSLAIIAWATVALSTWAVRSHPERLVARRAAIGAIAAGIGVAFVQMTALIVSGFTVSGSPGV